MKIVIDADIPYVRGLFEPFAVVEYLKGGEISPRDVVDANALIVRTRTRCDSVLLEDSTVKIVATATIGVDHIDQFWCAASGIEVASAAGCNARAVAQWVFAGLRELGVKGGTIGIVGVGNVGSEVRSMAHEMGFQTLLYDPPLAQAGKIDFVALEYVLAMSDVVTLHVPLLPTTKDMVSAQFLGSMKSGAILLNSSRGEIVDEGALLASQIRYGIDVWRGEPNINTQLLAQAALATPHIGGYSSRGKARGTQAVVRAVAKFLNIKPLQNITLDVDFELENPATFDIAAVDAALRANPAAFEALRTIRN